MDPFFILLIGLVTVIGLIMIFRQPPFLALLAAALVVSFLAPVSGHDGDWAFRVSRVGNALGEMAGKITILIAMGAIIGQAMTRSGAADRIVQVIMRWFGEKRVPEAFLSSGLILSIPVFYDATFYLLLPLVRAVYRMTRKHYVLCLLAIGFGATLSHTLVPPTPGPLMVAREMGIPIGMMMLLSLMVAVGTMPFALLIARFLDRTMPDPEIHDENVRQLLMAAEDGDGKENGGGEEMEIRERKKLPPFAASIFPIILPVLLIAGASITKTMTESGFLEWSDSALIWQNVIYFAGDAQVALMLSAFSALFIMQVTQKMSFADVEKETSVALLSSGTIILITSAGGAFGAMLRECGVGARIQEMMTGGNGTLSGLGVLLLAFATASMIKTAQGSSTTAMITTAGIFSTLGLQASVLGFHPGYVAVAIGVGSCVTGWMNDSGFCIFASMSGMKETDVLRTWTIGLALVGFAGIGVTLLLSQILPMI